MTLTSRNNRSSKWSRKGFGPPKNPGEVAALGSRWNPVLIHSFFILFYSSLTATWQVLFPLQLLSLFSPAVKMEVRKNRAGTTICLFSLFLFLFSAFSNRREAGGEWLGRRTAKAAAKGGLELGKEKSSEKVGEGKVKQGFKRSNVFHTQ